MIKQFCLFLFLVFSCESVFADESIAKSIEEAVSFGVSKALDLRSAYVKYRDSKNMQSPGYKDKIEIEGSKERIKREKSYLDSMKNIGRASEEELVSKIFRRMKDLEKEAESKEQEIEKHKENIKWANDRLKEIEGGLFRAGKIGDLKKKYDRAKKAYDSVFGDNLFIGREDAILRQRRFGDQVKRELDKAKTDYELLEAERKTLKDQASREKTLKSRLDVMAKNVEAVNKIRDDYLNYMDKKLRKDSKGNEVLNKKSGYGRKYQRLRLKKNLMKRSGEGNEQRILKIKNKMKSLKTKKW